MKYAIIVEDTKEFYPDPIYEDKQKAEDKIKYLHNYQKENNMKTRRHYILEELTKEREEQHKEEWARYCSMID